MPLGAGALHDRREHRDCSRHRAVEVLAREGLGGRPEDRDRAQARAPRPGRGRARWAPGPGRRRPRPSAPRPAEHLLGVAHLRHPPRRHERGRLDGAEPRGLEPADELGLRRGRHDGLLVLQPVARTDLVDRHLRGQPRRRLHLWGSHAPILSPARDLAPREHPHATNGWTSAHTMNDGPLIVQSDKTLLLEVDHPNAEAARRAIAPFAELERAPEHVHTYRLTPLGLWNARAAGHDAEQVVDALLTHSRYAVPHALLVDVADTMDRYGRLTLEKDRRRHGLVAAHDRPAGARGGAAAQEDPAAARRAPRRPRPSSVHPSRARPPQAGAAQGRLAGRGPRRLRRRRGAPDRPRRRPTGRCGPTSSRPSTASGTAAPASSCSPAAPARRSSAPARWRPAKATTLILVTNTVSRAAVEGRAAQAHLADRGRDRRVLRRRARRSGRSPSRPTRC